MTERYVLTMDTLRTLWTDVCQTDLNVYDILFETDDITIETVAELTPSSSHPNGKDFVIIPSVKVKDSEGDLTMYTVRPSPAGFWRILASYDTGNGSSGPEELTGIYADLTSAVTFIRDSLIPQ